MSSPEDHAIETLRAELARATPSARRRIVEKFVLAALGVVPWVGGVLSAAVSLATDSDSHRPNELQTKWLEEHGRKMERLQGAIEEILARFETLGPAIDERIQSEEYLTLVRRAFRIWDEAETEEKRRCVRNLLANAAGTRLCSDDVVRLFLDWVSAYHEAHFAVIREIHQNPGSSRAEIWSSIYGGQPRDDSAEADLFKLLIRDLSTGGVIRQERDTNEVGQFVRKQPQRPHPRTRTRTSFFSLGSGRPPGTYESAFDRSDPYVLTALGQQFVHYTMNDLVARLTNETGNATETRP